MAKSRALAHRLKTDKGTAAQPNALAALDGWVFAPLSTRNPFEETVHRVMQVIKLDVVQPGDRLPSERLLSERLGVSRPTLREAIKAVEQAGFVETRLGRTGGTFVIKRPPAPGKADAKLLARAMGYELQRALDLRWAIEPSAAALAARRRTAEDMQRIREAYAHTQAAKLSRFRAADGRFHVTVAEASHSKALISSVVEIQVQLNDLLNALPIIRSSVAHSHKQHGALVDAISARRANEARAILEQHIEATSELLLGFLG